MKRTFKGNHLYGNRFPLEEEELAAKASDELVFEHLENGGKLWGKTKINFWDYRLLNLDKATAELISIIEKNDSMDLDENYIPAKSSTSKLSPKSDFLEMFF